MIPRNEKGPRPRGGEIIVARRGDERDRRVEKRGFVGRMLDNGLLGQFRGKPLCSLSPSFSSRRRSEDRGLSRVLGAHPRPSTPCFFLFRSYLFHCWDPRRLVSAASCPNSSLCIASSKYSPRSPASIADARKHTSYRIRMCLLIGERKGKVGRFRTLK